MNRACMIVPGVDGLGMNTIVSDARDRVIAAGYRVNSVLNAIVRASKEVLKNVDWGTVSAIGLGYWIGEWLAYWLQ